MLNDENWMVHLNLYRGSLSREGFPTRGFSMFVSDINSTFARKSSCSALISILQKVQVRRARKFGNLEVFAQQLVFGLSCSSP